jgi:hypothetical protein
MAKYSRGTFGLISGTVNSAVGSSWRGVNYLRNIAKKRSKGPSTGQLTVQAKLVLAANQLARIKAVLNLGFSDKKLNKITGYNAAVRQFILSAVIGEYPDFSVDYAKIQLSKGSLNQLKQVTFTPSENTLTLNWMAREDAMLGNTDDEVLVLLYNSTSDEYMTNMSAKRTDGELLLELAEKPGDKIEVWIFCVSKDRKSVSTSQYIGTMTVPL